MGRANMRYHKVIVIEVRKVRGNTVSGHLQTSSESNMLQAVNDEKRRWKIQNIFSQVFFCMVQRQTFLIVHASLLLNHIIGGSKTATSFE